MYLSKCQCEWPPSPALRAPSPQGEERGWRRPNAEVQCFCRRIALAHSTGELACGHQGWSMRSVHCLGPSPALRAPSPQGEERGWRRSTSLVRCSRFDVRCSMFNGSGPMSHGDFIRTNAPSNGPSPALRAPFPQGEGRGWRRPNAEVGINAVKRADDRRRMTWIDSICAKRES
jgi:hypothetical protein